MKKAYIIGAYRADTDLERQANINIAWAVATDYWRKGFFVLCPHTNSANMSAGSDKRFLDGYLEMIQFMDVGIVLPSWLKSKGSIAEVQIFKKLNKELIYLGEKDD